MTIEAMMGYRAVQALGWTLLHVLWQGALVAAMLAVADAFVARRSAGLRYALAVSALALMIALPVLTFAGLVQEPGTAGIAGTPTATPVAQEAGMTMVAWAAQEVVGHDLRDRLARALPWLVAAWGLGVLLLSVRVVGGWAVATRLARSGRPATTSGLERSLARLCGVMRISRPVRLLESVRVEVPTLVGWLRPVILFPVATLVGLTPAQLEVVLAHELAHVRRLDYLVNLLQTAVETLLFYHPAVWWVSQKVRVEREHCCDDAAVAACGDAVAYARALTELEGLRVGAAGLAMAADGGSLLGRVARLVGGPSARTPRASRALGGILAVLAVPAVLAGSGLLAAKAQTAQDAVQPAEPAEPTAPEPAEALPSLPAEVPAAETELTIEQVLDLARSGVTPEYLDDMAAAGYPALSWRKLVELRSHGVDPEFVRGMAAEGYSGLTPERLVELRSHGVGPEFVKELREQGLEKLSLSELVDLRSQGVGPEFVQELKDAGYRDLPAHTLVSLRSQGVTGEYAKELKALGYEGLSTTKLIGLRSQGITPEYVRELKDLGYASLSVPMLLGLRSQGVTPEYVRELKEAGYSGLPAAMLIELRSQGVTPEFVQELKDAGWGDLKAEDLIELRSQGVNGDLLRRLRRAPRSEPRPRRP
jgi:beta-lactamase regulating signal transducer with metallopeptidase domain